MQEQAGTKFVKRKKKSWKQEETSLGCDTDAKKKGKKDCNRTKKKRQGLFGNQGGIPLLERKIWSNGDQFREGGPFFLVSGLEG